MNLPHIAIGGFAVVHRLRAGPPLGAERGRSRPAERVTDAPLGEACRGCARRPRRDPAAPILWVESLCTTAREPGTPARAPLVNERGYARREADSYLSFPEWHIVYAYEDLAGVLRRGNESDFAYGRQIAGSGRASAGSPAW